MKKIIFLIATIVLTGTISQASCVSSYNNARNNPQIGPGDFLIGYIGAGATNDILLGLITSTASAQVRADSYGNAVALIQDSYSGFGPALTDMNAEVRNDTRVRISNEDLARIVIEEDNRGTFCRYNLMRWSEIRSVLDSRVRYNN